jgi:predicted DNA-binding transcriptional regulator YafY
MVTQSSVEHCLAITYSCTDKNALFSRLLRYGKSCKIVKPVEYQEEMKALLTNMLANYGV